MLQRLTRLHCSTPPIDSVCIQCLLLQTPSVQGKHGSQQAASE